MIPTDWALAARGVTRPKRVPVLDSVNAERASVYFRPDLLITTLAFGVSIGPAGGRRRVYLARSLVPTQLTADIDAAEVFSEVRVRLWSDQSPLERVIILTEVVVLARGPRVESGLVATVEGYEFEFRDLFVEED